MDKRKPKNERKSYLLAIMMVAEADNTLHGNELKYLYHIGNRFGFSKEEVDELRTSPFSLGFQLPMNEQEKMQLIYEMFFMMRMDPDIHPEEEKIFIEIATIMGVNYMLITDFLEVAKKYEGELCLKEFC